MLVFPPWCCSCVCQTTVSRDSYTQLDTCVQNVFLRSQESILLLLKGAWNRPNNQLALGSACPCKQSAAYSRAPRCKDATSLTFFMALYVDASTARKVRCGMQGSVCKGGVTVSPIEINSITPTKPPTQTFILCRTHSHALAFALCLNTLGIRATC